MVFETVIVEKVPWLLFCCKVLQIEINKTYSKIKLQRNEENKKSENFE